MNITTETINEFLAVASRVSTWDNARPGMWVRSRKTEGWVPSPTTDNPYTTMPIAVGLTPEGSDSEVMLLMYGTATPVDDGEEYEEDFPSGRVRVIMYFHDGSECVAIQGQGQTVKIHDDGIGEGMFPESLRVLRNQQKSGEWK